MLIHYDVYTIRLPQRIEVAVYFLRQFDVVLNSAELQEKCDVYQDLDTRPAAGDYGIGLSIYLSHFNPLYIRWAHWNHFSWRPTRGDIRV